jgi:hypothetical protein
MTFKRQCSYQAILLLLAMPIGTQAKAEMRRCLVQQLNASLELTQASPIMTWDRRYPGNEVAQILDRIQLGKTSRKLGNLEVLNKMAKSFKDRGIRFRTETTSDGHQSLIILPIDRATDPTASPLNRLAAGILKFDPNFELRYTPEMISESYTQGVYALQGTDPLTGHSFIELGHGAAIDGMANDQTLVHEIIHAKHKRDEKLGKTNPYSIRAIAIDPKRGLKKREGLLPSTSGGSYDSYFKFDELIAFRHNLWASARNFTESIRKGTDPSISRVELNSAITGVIIISKKAWASADIADTGLKGLELSKKLEWGKSVKFERKELKYKASIHYAKDAEGRPQAILMIEELPGLFSKRETVTSYALRIPLKANYSADSGVPTKLVHDYMENIRNAAKRAHQSANEAYATLETLENSNSLTALQKASLLQQLENVTRRDALPGYSPK